MRLQKEQLGFDLDLDEWRQDLLAQGLIGIPVSGAIAVRASRLAHMHGDPADRIIVATALEAGYDLITADRRILEWPGQLRRLRATD